MLVLCKLCQKFDFIQPCLVIVWNYCENSWMWSVSSHYWVSTITYNKRLTQKEYCKLWLSTHEVALRFKGLVALAVSPHHSGALTWRNVIVGTVQSSGLWEPGIWGTEPDVWVHLLLPEGLSDDGALLQIPGKLPEEPRLTERQRDGGKGLQGMGILLHWPHIFEKKNAVLFFSKSNNSAVGTVWFFYIIQILAFLDLCLQAPAETHPFMDLPHEGTLL